MDIESFTDGNTSVNTFPKEISHACAYPNPHNVTLSSVLRPQFLRNCRAKLVLFNDDQGPQDVDFEEPALRESHLGSRILRKNTVMQCISWAEILD